jgi:hypothetical protein
VWLSELIVTFALYVINRLVFITEAESVYCAVLTESLYNTDTSRPLKVKLLCPRVGVDAVEERKLSASIGSRTQILFSFSPFSSHYTE